MIDLPFSLDEALKTNVLVTGGNCTGKSRLVSAISSSLNHLGYQCIVFDNSGVWKRISDLPQIFDIDLTTSSLRLPLPYKSIIYDMSRLIPDNQVAFVDYVTNRLWDFRIEHPEWQQGLFLILEESQLYLRRLRSSVAQNLMRMASVGRNINTRIIAISPDLALIDASFIRLCQQRYHGKLGIEENGKRKFRSYYGKDWCRVATEGLQTGDFIYVLNNKIQVVSIDLFEPQKLPLQTQVKAMKEHFWSTPQYAYTKL